MKVLLSIRPEFVEKIISGEKKFEYRKRMFKREVKSVVIYATSPYKKIIGEFSIEEILADEPNVLWEKTFTSSGLEKDFFMDYYKNAEIGYAIKIDKLKLYPKPIEISRFRKTPPQSYTYIDD